MNEISSPTDNKYTHDGQERNTNNFMHLPKYKFKFISPRFMIFKKKERKKITYKVKFK
jgi:hypothetical protein